MFTKYGPSNRDVEQDLVVTYSKARIAGSWSYPSGTSIITRSEAWEYRRHASKRFKYVGMTKLAAQQCAAALIEYFTRSIKNSVFRDSGVSAGSFGEEDGGTLCMAEIVPFKMAGHMWGVSVSVREEDSRLSFTSLAPSSLFTTENARQYEGVSNE